MLAHNGIALMMFPLLCLYLLIRWKGNRGVFSVLVSICLGLGISAFFWIPALYEQKYVLGSIVTGHDAILHFLSVGKIIMSPWNYGADVAAPNGQSPQIGIVALIVLFLSTKNIGSALRKKNLSVILFLLGIIIGISPYSSYKCTILDE